MAVEEDCDNEQTPLNGQTTTMQRTPLPKFQLFIVLLIQFSEPVTALVIYPFVNQFVRDTGITGGDDLKTGYYAGIIESTFFMAEGLTVVFWGRLSDYYGRRPVLLCGPLGLSIAMICFGMSTTFWPLVFYRCLQGTFNGNIGVSKSVMAELTDSTNIADAFSMIPMMWSVGSTLGPIIGGVLSSPAQRWPETFGKIALFRNHSYLLPCLVASFLAFLSFAFAFLGLKETSSLAIARNKLDDRKRRSQENLAVDSDYINGANALDYGSAGADTERRILTETQEEDIKPSSIRELFTSRTLAVTFFSYTFFTFADMCNTTLLPLMFSTSIADGGLGLDPYTIGSIMGIFGLCNALFQVHILGRVIRRFGARLIFRVSFAGLLVCFGSYVVTSYLAKRAGRVDGSVYAVLVIQLIFQSMMYWAYGSVQILIVDAAPNKASLGSVTGFAQMLGCVSRSLGPSVASSLFSLSHERELAGGNMVYFFLMGVTVVGVYTTSFLPRTN